MIVVESGFVTMTCQTVLEGGLGPEGELFCRLMDISGILEVGGVFDICFYESCRLISRRVSPEDAEVLRNILKSGRPMTMKGYDHGMRDHMGMWKRNT